MRTHVMELRPGDRLIEDTFNRAGLHILPKGSVIQTEEIALLIRQSIDYVDIEPRDGSAISETTQIVGSQEFSQRLQENFEKTVQGFQTIFLEALTTGRFNQSMVDEKLLPTLEALDKRKNIATLLYMLSNDDVNIYNHSLQVGLLSYYIATWLGYSREECHEISKAGYLHDIGKSRVRQSIKNKSELQGEELEEMRRHTNYGYEIIRESIKDNETLALAALQHHENVDGSGYPKGIGKDEIHPYSQIVAVANAYVDMTTSPNRQPHDSLLTVLRKVYELGFGKLNEKAVQALTQNLLPSFIGKRVQLSNGENATIVYNNPTDIFRPLVKVDDFFRDLSRERDIEIQEIFFE
ncbi:HD-GYP domain-containing protein [Paenibacillus lentus]|uniref:HD domain-containing protein n=1 Tax=Paenibacillus lentus TaxID=1338368 RepID=A0A3Q8S4S3_9BACL|nr:HD domain-containing phosphohydrolase [Paenibacillus lentus]AZK46581.1 HD domain-containing protein [Paenibacillus lentus]